MPSFAPNFQYSEDIPHVSGDRGTVGLAVRKDNIASSFVDIDGDYTALQTDSFGRLRVTTQDNSSIKYLPIVATLLVNIVVPLVLLKKIRVYSYVLSSEDKNTATWRGLVTPLSGPLHLEKSSIVVSGSPDAPILQTLISEPLTLVLTSLKPVSGHITYVEV